MPTKPNRAGQQQNYVPKGNGDASGEYGDNATGSNKHFTTFKQPGETTTKGETTDVGSHFGIGGGTEETNKKKLKERLPIDESIESRMKNDYKFYLNWGVSKGQIKERMTRKLLNGDYGSFIRPRSEWQSKYEDFYDSMEEWMNENKPQKWYYKSGSKWVETYDKYDFSNRKYYNESEYQEKLAQEQVKNLKQSKYDVEVNKVFGENCAVAFGKGYSNEYMEEVVKASQNVANDFPDMKGFIKAIGDRNSLEKLTQARARQNLTEENITKVANEIIQKQKEIFGRDISLEDAKEKAKNQILNSGMTLSRSGSRTLAYWSPGQRALVMLPKTAKDNADANQVSYFQQNWHSSDKPMATYYHEFGHAIDSMVSDYARRKEQEISKSGDYQRKVDFNAILWKFRQDTQELADQNLNEEYKNEYVKRYNKIAGTNYQDKRELDKALNRDYSRVAYDTTREVKESLKRDGIKKYNVSEYGATNGQEFYAECFSAYYTGMNNELANKFVERVKQFYNDIRRF